MKTSNLIGIGLVGLLLFIYGFLSNNPDLVSENILTLLNIAVMIFGSIVIVDFLSFATVHLWFVRFKGKEASDLVKLLVALLLYGICTLIAMRLLGQDISAIFATSALITALVGFALQSTLGNLFSGVALQIDQPFQIGDRVIIDGSEGWVVSMTWRATTIRNNNNILIQIPNGLMADNVVKIIPGNGSVRRSLEFIVTATVPPQQVIDTTYTAILNRPDPNINTDKPIRVRMWRYQIADESLFVRYKVLYYPRQYDQGNSTTDRAILRRIWYALSRRGMSVGKFVSPPYQNLRLIRSIELFRNLSPKAQNILVKHSRSLLFDTGEILTSENLPDRHMFILIKGHINVQQKLNLTPNVN